MSSHLQRLVIYSNAVRWYVDGRIHYTVRLPPQLHYASLLTKVVTHYLVFVMPFDPSMVRQFHFLSWTFKPESATASFAYGFDTGERFEEELVFAGADVTMSPEKQAALDLCLRHLHLMLGISYYKAAVPPEIVIETGNIDEGSAHFFDEIYLKGLGEFAYRNSIDLSGRIRFPFAPGIGVSPSSITLPRRTAVPVGGGKDSVVSIEALRLAGEPMALFSLGEFEPIERVAQVSGLPKVTVKRRFSPALIDLNARGALNGHIPISAVIAFVLPVCAILYGFDSAALSNERSASVDNLDYKGMGINHQYSKGLEFERNVSHHFKERLLTGFDYFSLLRPLSELQIARLFSRSTAYHPSFTSCNAAFKIDRGKRVGRWCCACPKCRSTFLLLAPFMEKTRLVSIFGQNLLDQQDQINGFEELIGLRGFKPFECVGEPDEYLAALLLLSQSPDWQGDVAMRHFQVSVLSTVVDPDRIVENALSFSDRHIVPPRYEAMLHAYSGL
jgi:UDP-N-acetyl-alpha-D-muramoyl-L-alanyl-L-glutamate epimerase